jgi:hypothetical protein
MRRTDIFPPDALLGNRSICLGRQRVIVHSAYSSRLKKPVLVALHPHNGFDSQTNHRNSVSGLVI